MNAYPTPRSNELDDEVHAHRRRLSLPIDPLESRAPSYEAADSQRENLPDYTAEEAPRYDRELHERPLHTYYLRVPDKRSLIVVPYGPSASDSYRVASRSRGLFSKKPEMEVWRTRRADTGNDFMVAGIWFDIDGPLPWCPRAHFIHHDISQGDRTYKMAARNFSDWTISSGGTSYTWVLEARPFSLTLRANGMDNTVARFHFSHCGLTATGGAEAGDLTIYRDTLSTDQGGVEVILCSLVTAILQFKKMGRHYKNEPGAMPERAASLPEERLPMNRLAVAAVHNFGQG